MHTTDAFCFCLLTQKDAPALVALERTCFPSAWTEEQYRQALAPDTAAQAGVEDYFLAHTSQTMCFWMVGYKTPQGALLAYLSFAVLFAAKEAEVYSLAVSPPYRKQGLARNLLAFTLRAAGKCGILHAYLDVRPSNTPALNLYTSLGFSPVGQRKKYYPDTGEDALILCRHIPREGDSPCST